MEQTTLFLLLLLGLCLIAGSIAFLVFQISAAVRAYQNFHGRMLVTCPETQAYAAVKVAAWRAALAAFLTRDHVELCACSRWPERRNCAQDCLQELEASPEKHRVWSVASEWFVGQKCAYCQKPIGEIHHIDHMPALLCEDMQTVEWDQLPAQLLPDFFANLRAVCWNCHMAESFRRQFPQLVTDRNWRVPPQPPASKVN